MATAKHAAAKSARKALSGDAWKSLKDSIVEVIDDEIVPGKINEARTYLAMGIVDHVGDLPNTNRGTYGGKTAEDEVLEILGESEFLATNPSLRAVAERFAEDGVPEEFFAGIRFAAALVADHRYEY